MSAAVRSTCAEALDLGSEASSGSETEADADTGRLGKMVDAMSSRSLCEPRIVPYDSGVASSSGPGKSAVLPPRDFAAAVSPKPRRSESVRGATQESLCER